MPLRPLSPNEVRVLGTLMEKARTVPDSYPLTLLALVNGCNQKTSRLPLTQLSDTEVQAAIDSLKGVSLVFETSGGRVARFEHNAERVLGVKPAEAALLGLLMLRGPQTAGELRINAERWHPFADIDAVESTLQALLEMAESRGVSMLVQLPKAPGAREARWAQLLGGPLSDEMLREMAVPGDTASPRSSPGASAGALADLERRVAALEAEVAALRARTP